MIAPGAGSPGDAAPPGEAPAPTAPPPGEAPAPAAPPASPATARRAFLGFWLLYALFSWPGPPLDDLARRYLGLAEALARGSAWLEAPEADVTVDCAMPEVPGGRWTPGFGFGVSVLAAPLCAVTHAALAPARLPEAPPARRAWVLALEAALSILLIVAPAGAGTVVLLARTLERSGAPRAWETAALYGVGLTWPMSTTVVNQVPAALLVIGALWLLVQPRPSPREAAAAGALVGASVLFDFAFATPVALPFAALVVARHPRRVAAAFALGALVPAALLAGRNILYFGDPLTLMPPPERLLPGVRYEVEHGYSLLHSFKGLEPRVVRELLVGQQAGLFVFAPALALGLLGLPALARRRRDLAALAVAIMALALIQNATKSLGWYGGTSKGPRYLMPAALVLGLAAADGVSRWPRLAAGLGAVTVAVSFVQAQTTFYAELRSAVEDVVAFGPRLRLVHTVAGLLRPGDDASGLALLVSPLLAFPGLAGAAWLLAPPAHRRRAAAAALAPWLLAVVAHAALAPARPSRLAIRVAELERLAPREPRPMRLTWFGDELLGFGLPGPAAGMYLRAIDLGGWNDDAGAREGLGRAVRALLDRGEGAAAAEAMRQALRLRDRHAPPPPGPVGPPR